MEDIWMCGSDEKSLDSLNLKVEQTEFADRLNTGYEREKSRMTAVKKIIWITKVNNTFHLKGETDIYWDGGEWEKGRFRWIKM